MTSPCNKHSLPKPIHFCKIIPRTSLANGILKLPGHFTAEFGDGMSNPVFLNLPDSTEWKIYWTKHDGDIWFQKGWKEFSTRYSLDYGYLLVFEYVGISRFDVHILDTSAVEIDYPSHFTHHDDNPEEISDHIPVQISDDSVEILDSPKTGVKNTQSSSKPGKKMKNKITTDAGRSPNGVNLHQHDQSSRSAGFQKPKVMKQNLDGQKGKGFFHTECPKVEEQLTSSALHRATTSKSMHPSFKLVMKPSFFNADYLDIPLEFSEQYLKKTHAVVLLEVMDGRTWHVIVSAPRITCGWKRFASENNLKVGDVCVFELIMKIQSLAFKVSIIRSAGEPSSPISHGKGGEEARKFTSENPFFMATLRLYGNTTRCPRVPSIFARKYFVGMKQDSIMMQFRKKLWPVTIVLAKYDFSGTLSAGWPLFSRENKLQGGDVCVFELANREDVTLDVHVFRGQSEIMH